MQKGQNIHFTSGWKFSVFSPRWKVLVSQNKFTAGWISPCLRLTCLLDLDMKSAWITLLKLDWFYDILDLDYLKKAWTTLLDWHWFCYKFELDWRNELTKKWCHYKSMKTFLNYLFSNLKYNQIQFPIWKTKHYCC